MEKETVTQEHFDTAKRISANIADMNDFELEAVTGILNAFYLKKQVKGTYVGIIEHIRLNGLGWKPESKIHVSVQKEKKVEAKRVIKLEPVYKNDEYVCVKDNLYYSEKTGNFVSSFKDATKFIFYTEAEREGAKVYRVQ